MKNEFEREGKRLSLRSVTNEAEKLYVVSAVAPKLTHRGVSFSDVPVKVVRLGTKRFSEAVYQSRCRKLDSLEKEEKMYIEDYIEESFTEAELEKLLQSGLLDGHESVEAKEIGLLSVIKSVEEIDFPKGMGDKKILATVVDMPVPVSARTFGGWSELVVYQGGAEFDVGIYYDVFDRVYTA